MHQTFYIDIDEEITSIVERLRSARTNEVIIVVPKRALLIQSIVNLKILKKEADDFGIQLMVVTQDKLGKVLVEKAGILVQQKIDNLDDEEIDLSVQEKNPKPSQANPLIEKKEKAASRLNRIGSKSYFDESAEAQKEKKIFSEEKKDNKAENLINKELVLGFKKPIKKKKNNYGMDVFLAKGNDEKSLEGPSFEKNEGKIDLFPKLSGSCLKIDQKEPLNLPITIRPWLLFLGAISLFLVLGVAAYLFIPKAQIIISTKPDIISIDSEIIGNLNVKEAVFSERIVPGKIVSVGGEISKKIMATGEKSVSNQKAKGKIIIYNEFNEKEQPLVATTRFLSSNGKLFRLVQGVVIPGMKKVDNEIKPGEVEAEVVADQSGSDFNIGPEKFTIPGFQGSGSDKYNKFYAISKEPMAGGGDGMASSKFITNQDIALARQAALSELKKIMTEKMNQEGNGSLIILEDALNESDPVYKLSNSQGDVVDSFQITVQAEAKTISVEKEIFNQMVLEMLEGSGGETKEVDKKSLVLSFGKSDLDLEKGIVKIKFKGTGRISQKWDPELIKKDIAGKKEEDLKDYLKGLKGVQKFEIKYSPYFLEGRIPFWIKRIDLEVAVSNS